MKMKTIKAALLASALAVPALPGFVGAAAAVEFGLPNGASCATSDIICRKDAAKWTAQDTKDAAGKLAQNAKDVLSGKKGLFDGAQSTVQIGTETAEKIAHDRAGATKGYTDRKVGDGVKASEGYTDERIGDLGKVAVNAGDADAGNAKWNTDSQGRVVNAEGAVIHPHFKDENLGKILGKADGYYTVDSNTGGLVLHNAAGGTVYQPGQISGGVLQVKGETLQKIGEIMQKGGAEAQALGKKIQEFGGKWDNNSGTLTDAAGKVIVANGKLVEAAGEVKNSAGKVAVNIGGKETEIGKWLQQKGNEQSVIAAGGKAGQQRDKTVKEYVDEKTDASGKKIADNADAITKNAGDIAANKTAQDSWNTAADGKITQNAGDIAANKGAIAKEVTDREAGDKQTLADAKTHTDTMIGDLGGSSTAAEYADKKAGAAKTEAIATANGYTDTSVDAAKTQGKNYVDAQRDTAMETGKNYVDGKFADVNQNISDTAGRTLSSANAYTDGVAVQTLGQANRYTDQRYNQLNGKLKKLRARSDSGTAAAVAIGSLAFDSLKPNSMAGGLSVAKNKVAGAVGYQRNFNANWRARGTLAVSDNYVTGGASVGYSF